MNKYKNNSIPNSKSNPLFQVPATIDLIALLTGYGFLKELKHLPKYEYFISLIYSSQSSQNTYVPLSNAILRKVIRQPIIKRMKDNLFAMGVLECNFKKRFEIKNGKSVGLEPFGYKITAQYYMPHTIIPTNKGYKDDTIYNRDGFSLDKVNKSRDAFLKKIIRVHQTRWDDLVNLDQKPEYKFIRENSLKLEIDEDVFKWIEKQVEAKMPLKSAKCEFVNKNGKQVSFINRNRFLDTEQAEQWKNQADKIKQGVYKFSCPASVNRVYYNITSMPSELRKFLKYKGKSLVHLDYSNFQPFLFIHYLKEKYKNDLPLDVVRYIDLTSRGVFYAEVKKIIMDNNIEIKDETNFKFNFFKRVFFSSEKRNDRYRSVFAKAFPSVSAVISLVKKENYKALPVKLQQLEAEIVINTILREIAQKYPESFVLPVHDALICEVGISETVKQLMKEKTKQAIGFEPAIKQELLIHGN